MSKTVSESTAYSARVKPEKESCAWKGRPVREIQIQGAARGAPCHVLLESK